MKIVVAGEILWDLIHGEEHLGGAPLNFAVNVHRLGHEVTLVSAVGNDDRGRRAIAQIVKYGLSTDHIRRVPQPTGTVTVALDYAGEPDYIIHRPAAYDFLDAPPIEADWLYFGTLIQTNPHARAVIAKLGVTIPNRLYDVNLRKNSYTPDLVEQLLAHATAVKMNNQEAAILGVRAPQSLNKRYVAITRGAGGCVIWIDGDCAEIPGQRVEVVDTVGAGDAFAAAFLDGIARGWGAEQVGRNANRAGSLTVTRPGAIED